MTACCPLFWLPDFAHNAGYFDWVRALLKTITFIMNYESIYLTLDFSVLRINFFAILQFETSYGHMYRPIREDFGSFFQCEMINVLSRDDQAQDGGEIVQQTHSDFQ
ncbi:hypothetical protein STEG23_013692, partial [Scotinomys teguina]